MKDDLELFLVFSPRLIHVHVYLSGVHYVTNWEFGSGCSCLCCMWEQRLVLEWNTMQGKHVVAVLSAMLFVCAICCVPVVSLELFVSDGGVDEVGSTHVQTIPFALNQDGTEVDMTLGPQEYPVNGIDMQREIVRFRGFSRSGTALVSPGTNRVLALTSTDVFFADLTVRDGRVFSDFGGCVLVSSLNDFSQCNA